MNDEVVRREKQFLKAVYQGYCDGHIDNLMIAGIFKSKEKHEKFQFCCVQTQEIRDILLTYLNEAHRQHDVDRSKTK